MSTSANTVKLCFNCYVHSFCCCIMVFCVFRWWAVVVWLLGSVVMLVNVYFIIDIVVSYLINLHYVSLNVLGEGGD